MGLNRSAPWWLGWALAGALVSVFAGERILEGVGPARAVLSGGGALALLGCVAWRALSWRSAAGAVRRVEGLLLLAHAGCVLALVGYLLSSEDGMRWLGLTFADQEARERWRVPLQVLWPIVLSASLLPVLGAQLALRAHRHARGDAERVEAFRVVETARGGLVVALAGAFLFVMGYVTSERDRSLDLSYFKTSSPGTATEGMVSNLDEPLSVLLFFPEVNPVKDEVLRYFRSLADATGRVRIEPHDRLASPRLAEEHRVTEDGTVLFVRGEQSERLVFDTDLARSRPRLRTLDRDVQRTILPLLRERRTVYMTTGHGELNDPSSAGPFAGTPLGQADALKEMLRYLNYDVRDLGLTSGLGNQVPPDAAIVMVLGPRRPFLEEETAALDRYLARGGALLLALDPDGDFRMDVLEERLGVRYVPVPLVDEEQHLRQRGDASDRRFIITDRFSSHEAVTTLSRAGAGAGVLMVGPGHLENTEDGPASPLFVVRSLASTFADVNRDYRFDEGAETRRSYNLVAAVEVEAADADPEPGEPEALPEDVLPEDATPDAAAGEDADGRESPPAGEAPEVPSAAGEDAAPESTDTREPARPMRALVYASSAVFSDAVLVSLGLNAALVADGVKWLGGEEAFAGSTESEEDVPIVHTRAEDVAWFYATIFGMPGLVLVAGLAGVYRRRHGRRAES